MDAYSLLLRKLAFLLPAETAHHVGMRLIRAGLVRGTRLDSNRLAQNVFGNSFSNPLGLAAGFDKDAVALNHWHNLGFGFVELGTLTLHPQPGNPKPRMFRVPEAHGLINRLGFNNGGAESAAARLRTAKPQLPFGINLGINKEVKPEEAANRYAAAFRALSSFGDYAVVNVSSPNTPGLRMLQQREALAEIFAELRKVDPKKPLLLKIAPDLDQGQLEEMILVASDLGLAGIVATNTTISRDDLPPGQYEQGGLSGKPLTTRSLDFMKTIARNLGPEKVLIGVGGIMNGQDLFDRFAAGATLCQAYTGFVYGGPFWPGKTLLELQKLMDERGITHVSELNSRTAVQ